MSPEEARAKHQWAALKQQRDASMDQIIILSGVIGSLEAELAEARAQLHKALNGDRKPDP